MKSLVIISGITFSLALLLGVLSGNLLLTLVVRSVITTGVVAGSYVLIREVFKKYMPDLFDEAQDGSQSTDDGTVESGTGPRKGRKVNILVDDSDEDDNFKGDNDENMFQDPAGLDDVVEEVQESGIARVNSDVELLDQNDEQHISDNELPDISGLQSTFVSSDPENEQSSSSESDDDYHEETQYSRSRSKKGGNEQLVADPKILAKAISTALKKGQ
jgi:hypothetical protein